MHPSSYNQMEAAINEHLGNITPLNILDVGSYDVNGSYKPMFARFGWSYTGFDQTEGPNVDVVSTDPHKLPFDNNSFDAVVSGQAFEHMEYFWIAMLEIARVLKPDGKAFIIAPSKGFEHRYPIDCWRFYPDGFRTLGKWSGLTVLEVKSDLADHASIWGDTLGVFHKPADWSLFDTELYAISGAHDERRRAEMILIPGRGK